MMSEDEAVGSWQSAVGSRQSAMISVRGKKVLSSEGRVLRVKTVGSWQLAVGSWQLAVGNEILVWGLGDGCSNMRYFFWCLVCRETTRFKICECRFRMCRSHVLAMSHYNDLEAKGHRLLQ